MPFHVCTAGTSLNNATYTSHKKTVHIPGSHALPPGVSTTMAWELGYARKRFDADTRGIDNTLHPDIYHLRNQGEPWTEPSDAKLKHDEALLLAEELQDYVKSVGKNTAPALADIKGGVSGDVKNLDQLNPYFMHLELLKKKYAPDQLITWSNSGRKGHVPVGGWPNNVQFEMGVKYMPEIAEAVFVMKPLQQGNKSESAKREAPCSPIEGETKSEQLLREILQIHNDKSLAAMATEAMNNQDQENAEIELQEEETNHGDTEEQQEDNPNLPLHQDYKESTEISNDSVQPHSSIPHVEPVSHQTPLRWQDFPQPSYFPLPAVSSITVSNPVSLPQSFAYNRRYHQTPIHPDYIIDPETGIAYATSRTQLQIPAKYLATYNKAALVNGRPLAVAIPGTTPATSPAPEVLNHISRGGRLPPAYNTHHQTPLTTSAIAALSGLGAIGMHEHGQFYGRGRVYCERIARQEAYARFPVPPPLPRDSGIPPLAPVLNGRVPLPSLNTNSNAIRSENMHQSSYKEGGSGGRGLIC
ncbi:hypothetical protein BDR26DRAFT_857133 [Obelidium mucronatum]|nr:hypothetical protein BDR26DRAFT_857133 [Obelidium mucronatum]